MVSRLPIKDDLESDPRKVAYTTSIRCTHLTCRSAIGVIMGTHYKELVSK